MIEFIQRCWKTLVAIPVVIGVVGGIMTIPGYVATPAALKQMKEEIKTEFQKSMQLERDLNRVDRANESLLKLKIQQRAMPRDKSIQDDIDKEETAKSKAQDRIEKR
jgi:biopolymer transport protein ExbB/TolQ